LGKYKKKTIFLLGLGEVACKLFDYDYSLIFLKKAL